MESAGRFTYQPGMRFSVTTWWSKFSRARREYRDREVRRCVALYDKFMSWQGSCPATQGSGNDYLWKGRAHATLDTWSGTYIGYDRILLKRGLPCKCGVGWAGQETAWGLLGLNFRAYGVAGDLAAAAAAGDTYNTCHYLVQL